MPNNIFTKKASNSSKFNHKTEILPPSVKVSARAYSPSEIIIRLVNLHDTEAVNVTLVDKDDSIPILTYLSGMKDIVKKANVEEISLNTIMTRKESLDAKFKLHEIGKINVGSLLHKGSNLAFLLSLFTDMSGH